MKLRTAPLFLPELPPAIAGLAELIANLRWTWHPRSQQLFASLDPVAWKRGASPSRLVWDHPNLPSLAGDASFVKELEACLQELREYVSTVQTWYAQSAKQLPEGRPVAYFCAEYALHESLPQYSGGLGVLAGDHCKEASDMGLPFVAVGLVYRRGFFSQMINPQGRQEHEFPRLSERDLPFCRALDSSGRPLSVSVALRGREVHAAVWIAQVGRIQQVLLDTDVPENAPADRVITSQLYTSTREMRLAQELILGIGGTRALAALGIQPHTWHMNEGHSAFLIVERLLRGETRQQIIDSSILTIHTPVPAGNERFEAKLVKSELESVLAGSPVKIANLLNDGLGEDGDKHFFDLTAFALRQVRASNGVSLLHGETACATWEGISLTPVGAVTNGVHMATWLGEPIKELFCANGAEVASGLAVPRSPKGPHQRPRWAEVERIAAKDLKAAKREQKSALIRLARERLFEQFARHGAGPEALEALQQSLSEDAFFIGFARRFATYKRASLMFSQPSRLKKLLGDPKRPTVVLFAGKAHPADGSGQQLIAEVFHYTQSPAFRGRVVFLEGYDMALGRGLVQGVDMWLNNPRRPLEASGTSGMKAAANGAPNASILDGWWDEGYDDRPGFENGFAIGDRTTAKRDATQDKLDGRSLYEVLERAQQLYFDDPAAWDKMAKNAIASSLIDFSTHRMLEDYLDQMYV